MRVWIATVTTLLLPAVVVGQGGYGKWFGMTWSMAAPIDHTKDWTNDYSFRGIGLEWRQLSGNKSFGFNAGWNVFNQEKTGTTTFNQGAINGDAFRYNNTVSLLLSAHVYGSGSSNKARPFLGLKGGTYFISRRVDAGLWTATDENWHWGVAPELGFTVPMKGGFQSEVFYAQVRYNYAFSAGDAPYQSWFGIDVGFAVRK